jgi:hypothetical protein
MKAGDANNTGLGVEFARSGTPLEGIAINLNGRYSKIKVKYFLVLNELSTLA